MGKVYLALALVEQLYAQTFYQCKTCIYGICTLMKDYISSIENWANLLDPPLTFKELFLYG